MSASGRFQWIPGARGLGWCVVLALCLGAMTACETTPATTEAPAGWEAPVWPPQPERARIRWVSEIREPVDAGIRPGGLRRLWNWVTGKQTPHLVRPHGVSIDPRGRLWVTDPGARRIHVFDTEGGEYTSLPRKGDAPLLSPIAVAHDPRGVAYVSDSAARVIRRFDRDGRALEAWDGGEEFVRPTGLAFDPDSGLLWVSDTGSHRLLALDAKGVIRRFIGERGRALGRFNYPTHLTRAADGHLMVTDTLNFRVQILSAEGEPLSAFGEAGDGPGTLSKPKGIGLDRDGHIYVVDALFDNVQIFDRSGNALLYFGDRGSGPGQFWLPAGLAIAEDDRIYVADAYNQRVQVFEYLGE